MSYNVKPQQKVSYAEKTKNINKEGSWSAQCIDYYIGLSTLGFTLQRNVRGRNLKKLYDVYNNIVPEEYFTHVTNPLGEPTKSFSYPSRIREFPLLRPNIDLLRGEFSKRPFNWTVIRTGEDAYNEKQYHLYEEIKANITQHFINHLVQQGMAPEEAAKQDIDYPDNVKIKFSSNYKDEKAYKAQCYLKYLMHKCRMKEGFEKGFLDWLIAGECYFYTYPKNGTLDFRCVSPIYIDYDKAVDADYIDEGEWVVERMDLTVADVIDNFKDNLTSKEIDEISTTYVGAMGVTSSSMAGANGSAVNPDYIKPKVPVYRVVWKSFRKVGILTYIDDLGEEQQMTVDEEYKKLDGESIEWVWINEIWQGYRIGDKIYKEIKRLEYNIGDVDNNSKCKLPYTGCRFSDRHTRNISIVEMGLPILIMYIIINYRLELTISKHKGKILMLDINAIPQKDGFTVEKFMYYAESMGYAFVDRNQIGVDKGFNQYSSVDLNQFQHINELIQILEYLKKQWDDLLGITNPRKGQVQASESATGTERSVFQSSIMTETIFSKFDNLISRVLENSLEWAKFLAIDGVKFMNVTEDYQEPISIDFEELLTDLGIFVTNSSKEQGKLEAIKNASQALAQNGANPYMIAEIINAENYSEIKRIINKLHQEDIERQQSQAQSEQQAKKEMVDAQNQAMLAAKEYEKEMIELQGVVDKEIELIKQDFELNKVILENDQEATLAMEKIKADKEKHQKDMEIKREELSSKEKIAAMKPKPTTK